MFDHVGEKTKHALLECCGSIAQSKGYASVGESSEWAGERSLLLVLCSNRDLIVSRVSIQENLVLMSSQAFKHLVDEEQRKVVFMSGRIQLSIVNSNTNLGRQSCLYQLFLLILYHRKTSFLGDRMNRANPLAIRNGINDPIV